MLDPVTTPLLVLVLGKLAHEIIADACKDHLKDKLKSFFGWLESLGQKDKVELAYQDAMEQAYGSCLEMLLLNIKGLGYTIMRTCRLSRPMTIHFKPLFQMFKVDHRST